MYSKLKVIGVTSDAIVFDGNIRLTSDHEQDCCESHSLYFRDLNMSDFEGLEFDLNGRFFNKIEGFGIELVPIKGHPVRVAGYGSNNGYYSSNLKLCLYLLNKEYREYDITECQTITD